MLLIEMQKNKSPLAFTVTGMVAVTLIVFKFCGIITWPWLWVTIPIWGTLILMLIIMLVVFIIMQHF